MTEGDAHQKKAFGQLYALGPAVMVAVDERLTRGESGMAVARWLQQDLLQLVHMKPESLKKSIERYRTLDLRPRLEAAAKAEVEAAPLAVLAAVRSDALTQLEDLAVAQQVRVNAMLEREKSMNVGIVLRDVSAEIRLLKEILDTVAHLQLDTGRLRRAPKTTTGMFVDEEGKVQQFTWTEETEALFAELRVVGGSRA